MTSSYKKRKRENMPPFLTILILFLILTTIGITRISIGAVKPEVKAYPGITTEGSENQYIAKKQIINMLTDNGEQVNYRKDEKKNSYYIYTNCLKSYLSYSRVNIEDGEFEQLKDKITELTEIMKIEKETDFTKMTLDGRAVALDIAGKIYELCGLTMVTDLEGNIQKVIDQADNTIYHADSEVPESNFQLNVLIVTLVTIVLLLFFVIAFVKKNNLYQKEDSFDEFKEKRYA